MRLLTVREHGEVPIPADLDAVHFRDSVLRATVGRGVDAFTVRGTRLYARDHVGSLDVGGLRIEVLPKVAQSDDGARNALFDLLRLSGLLPRVSALPGAIGHGKADVLESIAWHVACLVARRVAGGLPRRYVEVQREEPFVRGRLDFSRMARHTDAQQHVMPLRYAPLTQDNALSQLIRALVAFLRYRVRAQRTRSVLAHVDSRLDLVRRTELSPLAVEKAALSKFEADWEPLLRIARVFASGKSPDPIARGDLGLFTFLFPMNTVFERLVRHVLRRHMQSPLGVTPVHMQWMLRTVPYDEEILSIKPDLLFQRSDRLWAVGDAKWKTVSPNSGAYGLAASDVYQVMAYMRAYETEDSPHGALLFFPRHDEMAPWPWVRTVRTRDLRSRIGLIGVDVERLVSSDQAARDAAGDELAQVVSALLTPA